MATSRLDFQSSVDRYGWMPNRGFFFGFPSLPGASSNATTGVPTNGIVGFAPGALFFNYKATGTAPDVYMNTGTQASATWEPIAVGSATIMRTVAGIAALDGSNPTPVSSGLTTILACGATLSGTSAPGLGTSTLSTAISGTTINVYGWMPTGAGDTTLIASTGTESFNWWAFGL